MIDFKKSILTVFFLFIIVFTFCENADSHKVNLVVTKDTTNVLSSDLLKAVTDDTEANKFNPEKLIIIGIIIFILILGLIKLLNKKSDYSESSNFSKEFINQLQKYLKSGGKDLETYTWLIHRSPKMQNEMDSDGILNVYRPPFRNIVFNNYQIIVNMIPELKVEFESEMNQLLSNSKIVNQLGNMIQESIIRHLGILEDYEKNLEKSLKNPMIWFREGIKSIVVLPFTLLYWLGIFTKSKLNSIFNNFIIKILSSLVTIIGFIGAIMTIFLGWEKFLNLIKGFIR